MLQTLKHDELLRLAIAGRRRTHRRATTLSPSGSADVPRSLREQGSIPSELIMVIPVMLLIAGSALRFYQELQAHQIGMTLAREAATLAYYQCVDKTATTIVRDNATKQEELAGDGAKTLEMISNCLSEEILPVFLKNWQSAKPIAGVGSVTITLEAYRCDVDEIISQRCDKKAKVACSQKSNESTANCMPTDNAIRPNLTSLRNRLVVAKVEFTISPLNSFIPSIDARAVTYEATV